jgi:hypothetical protein
MKKIKVKAAAGLLVPTEENGRRCHTEDKADTVPETAYYLRRLADGDLVKVEEK